MKESRRSRTGKSSFAGRSTPCRTWARSGRRPVWFLVWQAAAALLLLIGAAAWRGGGRRVIG